MEFTNSIGLLWQMTKPLVRRQLHATLDGCRAVVEFEGFIYQVDVKPVAKVPVVSHSDQAIEAQEEEAFRRGFDDAKAEAERDYVAPDGSC